MRTLRAPHERMPRLRDVLEYLATPGLEDIWLLLDIKVKVFWPCSPVLSNTSQLDNDADTVMRRIAETIESVPPSPRKPWNKRVVLGCWAVRSTVHPKIARHQADVLCPRLNISLSAPITSPTTPSPISVSPPPTPASSSPPRTSPLTSSKRSSSSGLRAPTSSATRTLSIVPSTRGRLTKTK